MYKIYKSSDKKINPLIVLLAFIAGCTNENTSPFVVLIALLPIVWNIYTKKNIQLNNIIYFISSSFGAGVLILAPGNFIRATQGEYWYSKPLYERIFIHVTERLPSHLALIWISFVIIFLLFFLYKLSIKNVNKEKLYLALLMLIFGVGTAFIMFAAPSYPDRAMGGTFLFFLIAISFITNDLLESGSKCTKGVMALTVLLLFVFIWSYSLMYEAYKRTYSQDVVRKSIIKLEKEKNNRDFYIPNFYFTKLQNSGGHFGFSHNVYYYSKYFGVNELKRQDINFDYSVLVTGTKRILPDNILAYTNKIGDMIIVSPTPLCGTTLVNINNTQLKYPHTSFKTVKINNEFWNYHAIPKGSAKKITIITDGIAINSINGGK